MSESLVHGCDVCGAVKRESNHWFHAIVNRPARAVLIFPWDYADSPLDFDGDRWDLCGMECAHKALSAVLQPDLAPSVPLRSLVP